MASAENMQTVSVSISGCKKIHLMSCHHSTIYSMTDTSPFWELKWPSGFFLSVSHEAEKPGDHVPMEERSYTTTGHMWFTDEGLGFCKITLVLPSGSHHRALF
jgi:hypothetical protein